MKKLVFVIILVALTSCSSKKIRKDCEQAGADSDHTYWNCYDL